MELHQIKEAHILDILFDGRNKEYGAYELRMTYNRRLVKALVVMGSVVLLVIIGGVVMGHGKGKRGLVPPEVTDVMLDNVKEPPPMKPPPPVLPPQQQVAMKIFTPPVIVKEDVKPDERPPENDELDKVKIGTVNKDGVDDGGLVGPPAANGLAAGVVAQPKKEDDGPMMVVEVDASFPGGMEAWMRFLNKNFKYPEEAENSGIGGMVVVQFVVDLDGNVSDVQAISGPESGGLREEAVRVIRKSGKWVPALQNGRHVKAYRRQPIIFKPDQEN